MSILHESLREIKTFPRPEIKNLAQKRNQLFLVLCHPTPHWHWQPESCLVLPFSIRHANPEAKQNLGLTTRTRQIFCSSLSIHILDIISGLFVYSGIVLFLLSINQH